MKKKIFFAEDEVTMRETLREAFEEEGFEVETAPDGEDAISKIKNGKFDLILLDIILPKKDGFEVLEEIKKENLKTPVILLTNLSGAEDVQKALGLGARNYLVKSNYKLREIVEKVRENLD
ncbi:MAG: response regulator [Candidatus Moraniibacteriota bacterium]